MADSNQVVTGRNADGLIGTSPVIRRLREEIESAARSQAKILVLGETGSGKEVASRLIHALSARSRKRFVAMNCSGVPDALLESELFGHARGSFTGAFRDKPGLAQVADGGSLFLDEVGEMSLRMQAVVLRFVETGEVQPIGMSAHSRVDVRLIAATNRDLRARIVQGEFREDLFYRLNVIEIRVPSLRERAGDIPALLRYYQTLCTETHRMPAIQLTAGAEARLCAYHWPGNVRELKNVVERLVVRQHGAPIKEDDLPREILSAMPMSNDQPVTPDDPQRARSGATSNVETLWDRMVQGENFWSAAHAAFKSHDLTRAELRELIRRGLAQTRGNYRHLVSLFNMEPEDYRRFLSFLYQYDCNLPFQPHRIGIRSEADAPDSEAGSTS